MGVGIRGGEGNGMRSEVAFNDKASGRGARSLVCFGTGDQNGS